MNTKASKGSNRFFDLLVHAVILVLVAPLVAFSAPLDCEPSLEISSSPADISPDRPGQLTVTLQRCDGSSSDLTDVSTGTRYETAGSFIGSELIRISHSGAIEVLRRPDKPLSTISLLVANPDLGVNGFHSIRVTQDSALTVLPRAVNLGVEESVQLKSHGADGAELDASDLKFASTNERVASVDASGRLTALSTLGDKVATAIVVVVAGDESAFVYVTVSSDEEARP